VEKNFLGVSGKELSQAGAFAVRQATKADVKYNANYGKVNQKGEDRGS